MKFLYKGILVASLAVCMASATVFATETAGVTSKEENISFNYQTNMFDIEAGSGVAADEELTVMLVKGDYSEQSISLSQINASDVYYVGQKTGTNYNIFEDLGVKYDSDKFTPGVYTLITSGETADVKKTKLVIGNAVDKNAAAGNYLPNNLKTGYKFGSVSETVRYYPEDANGSYIYVCYADFPAITDLENAGFVFQNISNQGQIMHLYKPLSDFNLSDTLEGIASINANIQIGVQINNVPTVASTGITAVENIVAIPYVKN